MSEKVDVKDAYLVTHMGCMDGSGCAIMFIRAGGKRENIKYVAAGMLERFIKNDLDKLKDKFVIFADIGLSGDTSEEYASRLEKRGNCVLLDHHVTSLHLKGREWCNVSQNFCGTEMLRQYLGLEDESSKSLSALIQDHDLWLLKDKRSIDLAAFTVFVGQDVFVDRFIDRDVNKELFTPLENELMKIMIRRRDQFIDKAIKNVIVKDITWNGNHCKVGYILSQEMNVSLLLDRLLLEKTEIDVGCQINLDRGSVSLRSRGGYDVSEMAKYFGGGGHKAASGHRIPQSIINSLIEELHG